MKKYTITCSQPRFLRWGHCFGNVPVVVGVVPELPDGKREAKGVALLITEVEYKRTASFAKHGRFPLTFTEGEKTSATHKRTATRYKRERDEARKELEQLKAELAALKGKKGD